MVKKTEGFWLEWENGEEKGGGGREKGRDDVEGVWGKLEMDSIMQPAVSKANAMSINAAETNRQST